MDGFTKQDLEQAQVVITSLISKCEKAKVNLVQGHRTLIENRIKALQIALSLLTREIEK